MCENKKKTCSVHFGEISTLHIHVKRGLQLVIVKKSTSYFSIGFLDTIYSSNGTKTFLHCLNI